MAKTFRLNMVNAVWGQQGHEFQEAFLDTLAESYGAGVRAADFIAAPEEARLAINDWAAQKTEDRIRNLIPAGYHHAADPSCVDGRHILQRLLELPLQ